MKNKQIKNKLDHYLLPFVTKPGRYLGNEINLVRKDLSANRLRFAIAFPEVYEIGMSSLATNLLYHLLNSLDFVYAERVFAPWADAEEKLREHSIPLHSLETFTPLNEFDVIGFTLQYELTYTNILNMLDLAGIPLRSDQRDDNQPLIIAGGPCTCNPEPMAAFIDAFYIGDAESGLQDLSRELFAAREEGLNRSETLHKIARLRGVYVPSLYDEIYDDDQNFMGLKPKAESTPAVINTQIIRELTNDHYPEKPLVPLIEVTHNRLPIEIMRGCTEGCRYCNAGMIYRPTRERSVDDIVAYTRSALGESGYEEISFLSLSASDYSGLTGLMQREQEALEGKQVNISFPSMRLDSFSDEIAEFAASVRKSGFTFAPEAGSIRLRRVINKNISDDDLMNAVKIALQYGWKTLKFYFMIGLPTETKEDVAEIAKLVKKTVALSKQFGRVQFNVSISPFSPKSHTPFQWEKQNTKEELLRKSYLLQDEFRGMRQVKFSWRDPKVSEIECILGRGDRRIADVIYYAWQTGAKFDGWSDHFQYGIWEEAFLSNHIDREDYLGELDENRILPWDHIDKGISKNYLRRERRNAFAEKTTIDCKDGTCFGCGIQRKNTFREFAECYQDLKIHTGVTASQPDQRPEKNDHISEPVKQQIVKYRVHFVKQDYARYLGHLDILRVFERAFRRAGIKLAYSEGFNPRPKFSFGPALSLGHASDAEYFDVTVIGTDTAGFSDDLNNSLPDGMSVIQVKEITENAPALTKSINTFDYQINLLGHLVDNDMINGLLTSSSIVVNRTSKGKERQINIRPYVDGIHVENGSLHIRTKIIDGLTARVGEITGLLFGNHPEIYTQLPILRRNQLITEETSVRTPMDF